MIILLGDISSVVPNSRFGEFIIPAGYGRDHFYNSDVKKWGYTSLPASEEDAILALAVTEVEAGRLASVSDPAFWTQLVQGGHIRDAMVRGGTHRLTVSVRNVIASILIWIARGLGIWAIFSARSLINNWSKDTSHLCPHCGYPRDAVISRCPECGNELREA